MSWGGEGGRGSLESLTEGRRGSLSIGCYPIRSAFLQEHAKQYLDSIYVPKLEEKKVGPRTDNPVRRSAHCR